MKNNKINDIEIELHQGKNIARQNIELLLDREEQLNELEQKSSQLSENSNLFYKQSKKVNRNMVCKKYRTYLFVFIFFLLFIYFLSSFVCGFDFHKCRKLTN